MKHSSMYGGRNTTEKIVKPFWTLKRKINWYKTCLKIMKNMCESLESVLWNTCTWNGNLRLVWYTKTIDVDK